MRKFAFETWDIRGRVETKWDRNKMGNVWQKQRTEMDVFSHERSKRG